MDINLDDAGHNGRDESPPPRTVTIRPRNTIHLPRGKENYREGRYKTRPTRGYPIEAHQPALLGTVAKEAATARLRR